MNPNDNICLVCKRDGRFICEQGIALGQSGRKRWNLGTARNMEFTNTRRTWMINLQCPIIMKVSLPFYCTFWPFDGAGNLSGDKIVPSLPLKTLLFVHADREYEIKKKQIFSLILCYKHWHSFHCFFSRPRNKSTVGKTLSAKSGAK